MPELDLVALAAFVGATVIPFVAALLQQSTLPSGVNTAIRFAVAVLAAAILCLSQGALNPADLAGSLIALTIASEAFYKQLWKPAADAVEDRTTFVRGDT